jgi:flagellar FliL protein
MLAKITGNKMILGAVVGIVGGLILTVILVVVMGVGRTPSTASAETVAKPGEKAAAAPAKTAAKTTPKAGEHAATEAKFGPTYVIKDRIVNLADPGGRRYLRFSVAIEFAVHETAASLAPLEQPSSYQLMAYDPAEDGGYQLTTGGADPDKAFQAHIKKYAPAIEDVVTSVLSSKTYDEIRSAEGKDQAKKEIKDRLQRVLGEDESVTNVYFTDFVVQ